MFKSTHEGRDKTMNDNALHGREVLVASSCPGGKDYRGTIEANQTGPHPFRVVDAEGSVLITFTSETAKQLRTDGVTSHMALV